MKLRAAVAVWMMCVVSLAFVNSPAVAAAGPNGVAISLRPSEGRGRPIAGPGYFVLTTHAGQSRLLHALITNHAAGTVRISLACR